MSDREIYSHSGSLASLVSDLKNGQRGIDSDSGDWVYKDYSGVIHAARSYKSYSGSVWNYNTLPTGLAGNRSLLTDSSGNLAVSAVTSTELGYLSGVTSAIQTQLNGKLSASGVAGRIPYFTGAKTLGSSYLFINSSHLGFSQEPAAWNDTYASIDIGINSIYGYTAKYDGYPLYISNNRYNDGEDKPYVSGGSLTYALTDRTFRWYINSGLTAGVAFSPTQVMMLGTSGLRISTLATSSVVVNNASGYLESSSVTATELGYLSGVTSAIQTQLAAKVSAGVLVANRALTTDASNNAESSSVTSTELGYLSGVTSAIQTQLNGKLSGSGSTGRIPYYYSDTQLANSAIYISSSHIGLNQTPAAWGSTYGSIDIGLNAIWGYTNKMDGFPLHISNNRYNDGEDKPYVNGGSLTYQLYDRTFRWYIDTGLTAGVAFTPTERMMLSTSGLYLSNLTASRAIVANSSGYLTSSSVTSTELSYLSGVTSAIQTQLNGKVSTSGLGLAGRIPYFYSDTQLANSLLYCSSRGIRFNQEPSNWGSSYSAMEFGANAIWGYTNVIDGFPLHISNNRYNDGTGDKPHVNGGSMTYALYDLTHRWYIDSALTAGVAFTPTERMRLSTSGLYLSNLTASRAIVTNSSGYLTSSSVTSTELSYLSGVTSAIQTQLNGKLSGSGSTGRIPYFTSSGTVGASKCTYSSSPEQFLWYTSANSELMRLVDEFLWLNTKLVCNGLSTGDSSTISTTSSSYNIDISTLTQYNIKFTSTVNSSVMLWKANVGTIIYLTNVGATQVSIKYDGESGGPARELYPGQTMMLMCFNTYGYNNWYSTWAIWRTDVNPSSHLND